MPLDGGDTSAATIVLMTTPDLGVQTQPRITQGDIYAFGGLPGAPIVDHTNFRAMHEAGGLVQIKDISFTGALRVVRVRRKSDGSLSFGADTHHVNLADAHAMITNGVWHLYQQRWTTLDSTDASA